MKNYLFITLLTLSISLTYTAIGFMLPQKVGYPPPIIEMGIQAAPEDLAAAGFTLFQNECSSCHLIGAPGGRGPDLSGIGQRAINHGKSRGGDFNQVAYLLEAMCQPGDFVVDGFANFMTKFDGLLEGGQLIALVAFLQDLGDVASVNGLEVDLVTQYCPSSASGGGASPTPAAAAVAAKPIESPAEALAEFGCASCHSMDSESVLAGPGLGSVGSRLDKDALLEALISPDDTLAEGFPPMMGGALTGNGFYDRMTAENMTALVDYLSELKGE
jgi:mono/diheme cytochrome c family protein